MTQEPRWIRADETENRFEFVPGEKFIVNIGSVGQPRDRDPRSCYAILEDDCVGWRRVEYDIEGTVKKILDTSCLDDRNGKRLRRGI